MYKTIEGKQLLWDTAGGQHEHWPIDARGMLRTGDFTAEPPEGVQAKLPPAPPRSVGVPATPQVKVFDGAAGAAAPDVVPPATRTRNRARTAEPEAGQ